MKVTIVILYMKNKVLPVIESRTRCAELPLGKIFIKKVFVLQDISVETIFLEKTILVVHGARFLVYTIHNVLHI